MGILKRRKLLGLRNDANLRKVVIIVAVLDLASYFGVEFAVPFAIDSVSPFADSVDFLEDASVNFLIAIALGWSATNRARVGMPLAGILYRNGMGGPLLCPRDALPPALSRRDCLE